MSKSSNITSIHHDQPTPGSPPELTNSKSSKSSSFHTSSIADDISQNLAHFEDITLDDVHGEVYARKMQDHHVDAKPRPNSSQKISAVANSSLPLHSRDLTHRQQHPQLSSRLSDHPPQSGLAIPPKRPRRRKPQSLQNTLLTNLNPSKRSRSVSPVSPGSYNANPRGNRISSRPASSNTVPPELSLHVRRKSWQPGRRKTVQELEAEYDDLDEDLPEDAIVWNVPISPRPANEREKSRSPRNSWSAAPSPTDGIGKGLGLDFSASGNPMTKPAPPKSPRLSSLPRSVSMTSIPEDCSLSPRAPGRSWDATLSDLSAEARMLTQVLEEHAEEKEKALEVGSQSRQNSPTRRDSKRASASAIELPPVRKGELMIDPLPVSKEKEKFLTRTRPSWLPPKDPEEEKRHLKEYQKMMAKALDAEKKKVKKQQVEQCKKDDTQETLAKLWEHDILPDWEQRIKDPKTRELCWKGITPRDRGIVWQRAAGNELGITEAGYNAALDRARAAEERLAALSERDAQQEKESVWFRAIREDVKEAFPELKIFQPGGPLHDTLIDVLMAYAMYRSDVGYVYGTHVSCLRSPFSPRSFKFKPGIQIY